MDDREELAALRRMAELEAKAGGAAPVVAPVAPQSPSAPQADPLAQPGAFVHEVPRAMAQNLGAKAASGFAGLAGTMLPGTPGQGARFQQATEQALSFEPKSPTSKGILRGIGLPQEYLVEPLAKAAGGKLAEKGFPVSGAITRGAVEAGPLAFGLKRPGTVAPKVERAASQGFSMTPEEAGAGAGSQLMSGLAGDAKLAKLVSKKNQPVFREKIAQDLGLKKGETLDREALESVREREGNAYEALRKAGKITVDDQFRTELSATVKDLEGAARDFEHRQTSPLRTVVESLARNPEFDASSAVSEIINLRKDAKKAFKQGDSELGIGSLQAAEAMESLLDRHVSKLPDNSQAMQAFREARVKIAKSYAADKALRGEFLDPQVYARMLEQRLKLTGGAKDVAEFARDFPKSSQKTSGLGSIEAPTWQDVIMAGVSGAKRLATELPWLFARPGIRELLASGPYQSAFIRRNPSVLRGAAASAAAEEARGVQEEKR